MSYETLKGCSLHELEELGSMLHSICQKILHKHGVPTHDVTRRRHVATSMHRARTRALGVVSVRVVTQHSANIIGFVCSRTRVAIADGGSSVLPNVSALSDYTSVLTCYRTASPNPACSRFWAWRGSDVATRGSERALTRPSEAVQDCCRGCLG